MRLYQVGMNVDVAQHGMKVAHRGGAPTMQRSVQSFGDAKGGISANIAELTPYVLTLKDF